MSADLKIRRAYPKDKADILKVIKHTRVGWDKKYAEPYYDNYFSQDPPPDDEVVYVGVLDGKIAGVIGYYRDRYETGNYWLGWFYVDQKKQKGGNGRRLFKRVVRELKKNGVERLYVYTSSHENYIDALIFYLKNGFRIESVIRDYYEEGEDQIVLCKFLQ